MTMKELQRCAEREVEMRRRVYARFVAKGTMSQVKANTEIRMMEEIARHFAELAEREQLL